jgi:hypothetical protein
VDGNRLTGLGGDDAAALVRRLGVRLGDDLVEQGPVKLH